MQSTRQEILAILKEERQATVEDLAERLELTPMTIRHHLNVLQAQNLVVASKVRRSKKVGRPRLVYTLTDAAGRLSQVVDFMEEQGFISRWEKSEEGYIITNINCPYRNVSREHDEVCIMDTQILTQLLNVTPQHLTSMRAGESSCRFLLVPKDS
jgi:predicted ArsR family transcriptional regulator